MTGIPIWDLQVPFSVNQSGSLATAGVVFREPSSPRRAGRGPQPAAGVTAGTRAQRWGPVALLERVARVRPRGARVGAPRSPARPLVSRPSMQFRIFAHSPSCLGDAAEQGPAEPGGASGTPRGRGGAGGEEDAHVEWQRKANRVPDVRGRGGRPERSRKRRPGRLRRGSGRKAGTPTPRKREVLGKRRWGSAPRIRAFALLGEIVI